MPGFFPGPGAYCLQPSVRLTEDLNIPECLHDRAKLQPPLAARWLIVLGRQCGSSLEKLGFSLRCYELVQPDISIVGR